MCASSTHTQAWILHLPIPNAHASLRGRPAHLNKEYHYRILTLITAIRTSFHRRRLHLPAPYIILGRAHINTILLDLPNTHQLRRHLLILRPRNHIPTLIVAIMNKSLTLLSKTITGSNSSSSNIRLRISRLRRRRIQRISRTRRTVPEILP
ncbi:hypothetical protein N0V84_002264 [Fusarium piperis]|uniref:Uncharacterized protein n=1 Tax=Fusarium piperis TaxID=1435070 RepID=A0A9W9BSJ6_9HYPO|nr:hypothetical protein N0V84_002264 [Fusarium piperis]